MLPSQLANWTDLEVGDYKSRVHSYYGEDQRDAGSI
jgi:hypothetical protein